MLAAMLSTSPVLAEPTVRSIFSTQAQGLNGIRPSIAVTSGSGTNVDFTRTQEVVKKVWLDDPSRIVLDTDSPLCEATNQGGDAVNTADDSGCSGGAQVVHLKQIEQVKFPNLPSTPSTLLSVVTENPQGKRALYEFEVSYSEEHLKTSSRLAIFPDPDNLSTASGFSTVNGQQVDFVTLEQGLQTAIARNLVGANSPLVARVQDFLTLVRGGSEITSATQQVGISINLVNKLSELGAQSQPVNHTPAKTWIERLKPAAVER